MRLRFAVVLAWAAGAAAATIYLPSLAEAGGAPLGGLVPPNAEAVKAAQRSAELFELPLRSDIAIVERDPNGLSDEVVTRVATRAAEVGRAEGEHPSGALFALPVVNDPRIFPAAREQWTTAVTWLYFPSDMGLREQVERAGELAAAEDAATEAGAGELYVGVTGAVPARLAEFDEIDDALPIVEGVTVALIAVLLAATFRSIVAPLIVLLCAGVAYLVSVRVAATVAESMGVAIPQDIEPLVVVLVLGIVTDYAIFLLAGARQRLDAGEPRLEATRRASSEVLPTVITAGLIVACGSAALLAGKLEFFRAFGPGLALTALVGLAVSVTLVPALLAIFGRTAFWPGLRGHVPAPASTPPALEAVEEDVAVSGFAAEPEPEPALSRRQRLAKLATARPVAALVALAVIAALAAAATGLRHTNLGITVVRGLPDSSDPREAEIAAGTGFDEGIVAPTEILVEGDAVARQTDALVRLEEQIGAQTGVAAILGPREAPAQVAEGVVLSPEGDAARYVVVFDEPPLGGNAIDYLEALETAMPEMLREAGLDGARVAFAGDTALASETVGSTVGDIGRIGFAALGVNLLLLALFLRSLVAPIALLLSSVLALAATLGIATYVFQGLLGYEELTFYVPFAAAVLLISLGSDYNVFVAGRIRAEADRRPHRDAVAVAAPRASRTIAVAGLVLAAGFAVLAIVPLRAFQELGFVLALGIVIDAFVVRSLLVPALISLLGQAAWWPRRPGGRMREASAPPVLEKPVSGSSAP